MISAETIRAALRCGVPGCKCGTSKTDVHCPAHNSDKANFSVSEKNGKILVHCQAGCSQAQVIEALKARNLWPANNGGPPKFKIIKAYDYVDAAGKMVFQSCRLDPKDFRQRRPDGSGGWIWKMAGVKLVPYRLPELLNAETIYIVEGEKDCENLAALGLVATTNVAGAGKWRPEYNQHFQGKAVVILPDNDDPGRDHAQKVAQHLHGVAASVKILELPGIPDKGDVSDWLAAGGTVEKLVALADATDDEVEEAYIRVEQDAKREDAQASELPPDRRGPPPPPTFPEIISAADLENLVFPEIDWLVKDIAPMGFGLLSARPKKGKTYLALNLGSAKASGGCALGKNELRMDPGSVLYIAFEDKKRRVKTRLKTIMQGEPFPKHLYVAEIWPRLPDGGLDRLDAWLTIHPDAKLVVIDTLGRFKPRKRPRQDDYETDLATGAAIADLAHKHNICILGIYHNRKTESDDPIDDVHGSTGMTAAADFIMVLRRGRGQADATLFVTGRDVEEQELALKFHPGEGLWELLGDAAEFAKSQERIEIIQAIREHGPKTPKELADIVGKKHNSIRGLLLKMVKDQEVKSVKGIYEIIKK